MKTILIYIVFITIIGIMIATNPGIDDYNNFVRQNIVSSTENKDSISRALTLLFGGIASNVVANATYRDNYLILSVYYTNLRNNRFRCIGIMGNFVHCINLGNQDGKE